MPVINIDFSDTEDELLIEMIPGLSGDGKAQQEPPQALPPPPPQAQQELPSPPPPPPQEEQAPSLLSPLKKLEGLFGN